MRLTPADSLPTANRSFTFKYYGNALAPQGTTPCDVMVKSHWFHLCQLKHISTVQRQNQRIFTSELPSTTLSGAAARRRSYLEVCACAFARCCWNAGNFHSRSTYSMVWSWSSYSVGKIGADIALESWLFGFRPCLGQGQFTLLTAFDSNILALTLARKQCFATFASVGRGWCDPPLAFPNQAL